MSEPLFQIHAPSVDTAEISQRIEDHLASLDPAEKAELQAVEALDFQPESAADAYGFDPALTSELFERPVELPDFKSRKYRFLFGPFRSFATWIYRQLSQHFQRSARNMAQAFYALVHEQIYVRHRLSLLEEALRFSARQAAKASSSQDFRMEAPPLRARAQKQLLDALSLPKQSRILLLEDPYLYFLPSLLERSPKSVLAHSPYAALSETWAKNEAARIVPGNACAALSGLSDDSLDLILVADLANWSLEPDAILSLLPRRLKNNGLLAVLYLQAPESLGFASKAAWKIKKDDFISEVEKSLELKTTGAIPSASADSFFAIFQKKESDNKNQTTNRQQRIH